jgi:hypothetical protein
MLDAIRSLFRRKQEPRVFAIGVYWIEITRKPDERLDAVYIQRQGKGGVCAALLWSYSADDREHVVRSMIEQIERDFAQVKRWNELMRDVGERNGVSLRACCPA